MIYTTGSYFRRELQNTTVQWTIGQMSHIQIQFNNFLQKKKKKIPINLLRKNSLKILKFVPF